MKNPPKIRCAIYTRKSTEEGLDQEFNSLDAQRVSGEAYIQSQIHEGWEIISTRYDDGGFSGGTLVRPALQALLEDIKQGKIDTIVVYKVDRLSRSLSDFAKLVDLFEQHKVSFVSVTQAFNTTNSMGRLTLNILLSFAQFEREVTGERIRDKFSASKKKGMWMGGILPLGYDLKERKLLVNEEEANQVQYIYQKYLELKSFHSLQQHLTEHGYRTKCWITEAGRRRGGHNYCKGGIKTILSNPVYLGKTRHKDNLYEGEHEAIVDQETWDKVQERIKINSVKRTAHKNKSQDVLFRGRLFDASGNRFTTTYSLRRNKRHHYYVNKAGKTRISVPEFNAIITNALTSMDIEKIALENSNICRAEMVSRYAGALDDICNDAIERVIMDKEQITVIINKVSLTVNLEKAEKNSTPPSLERVDHVEIIDKQQTIEIILRVAFRKCAGRKIGYSAKGKAISIKKNSYDHSLIQAITRAYKWNTMLDSGQAKSIHHIAEIEKLERTYIGDVLRLKYLAPEITTMILNGTQPRTLNVSTLIRSPIPLDWTQQKTILNIA
jgi:DNA invertase Pin-like site-specific DNA recombinase